VHTTPVPDGGKTTSALADNLIDVCGYAAVSDPGRLNNYPLSRPLADMDAASLTKLWDTGFDVPDLDTAHQLYRLSPLRTVADIWRLLGYTENPAGRSKATRRYTDEHLTALAIQYPDPKNPGKTLPHSRLVRVRPPTPIASYNRDTGRVDERKYDQPRYVKGSSSHSEPYFLVRPDLWERLYDKTIPLIITEGELKAAALGLAGFAAIAFGGATTWRAKGGTNRLHLALDPNLPGSIPILGREVILIPDVDYATNDSVRREFRALGNALIVAGASRPRIVRIPQPHNGEWKGIDDLITYRLGPRWSGDVGKVAAAHQLVLDVCTSQYETLTEHSSLNATDPQRCAERILTGLSRAQTYTVAILPTGTRETQDMGWGVYRNGRYVHEPVGFSRGTSGKIMTPSHQLRQIVSEDYNVGIALQAEEGGTPKNGPRGMPAGHPNEVLAHVDLGLPRAANNTLLAPFDGVSRGDVCVRTLDGILNLSACLRADADWDRRSEWILPPDHRWFSLGGLNVAMARVPGKPECPSFLATVGQVFENDPQKITCLQLWFGKIITAPMFVSTKQYLCLYGTANSGKSTLMAALTAILGFDEVMSPTASHFGRFDLAQAIGKRLMLFSEVPEGNNHEFHPGWVDVIKGITGGDPLTVEQKGRDSFSTTLPMEIAMVGNQAPMLQMDRGALRQRAIFLSTTMAVANPDPLARDRMLQTELSGILLWALQGAARLARGEKIVTPDSCLEDMEDVTADSDPASRFVERQLTTDKNRSATKQELTPDDLANLFHEWCVEHRHRETEGSRRRLGRLVREIHKVKSGVRWVGKGKTERYYPGLYSRMDHI
jgi:P4 family phage/plasmid primase-like protien